MIRWILCALRGHRMCIYSSSSGRWWCRCTRRTETDTEFLLRVAGW